MASTKLVPTTELEAVNTMLRVIGEARISNLNNPGLADAVNARELLREVSREVQTIGYHFNTEDEYPLTRNESLEINVPPNALNVDLDHHQYWHLDVTQRGTRLYNKKAHSYKFEEDILATIIFFLPFEELPEAARRYITIRAARMFQDTGVTEETVHSYTASDEAMARITFKNMEVDNADYNIMNERSVGRVVNRRI